MMYGWSLRRCEEILPGRKAVFAEVRHEVGQRRPDHVMRETRQPGDGHAQRQVLVQRGIARQPSLHEGQRTGNGLPRLPDLLDRMRRFELHPIDAGLAVVRGQPLQRILQSAIRRIACIALRDDDKIRVELVLHVDRSAVPHDRLFERHHLQAGTLGAALAFDRLVVDADAGDAGTNAVAHQTPHRHDAAVAGIAVDDHRRGHAAGDPAGDLYALGHRGGADIGHAGIAADHAAGADEQRLAARAFHDARERRGRRVHHRQHLALAMNELLQARRRARFLTLW